LNFLFFASLLAWHFPLGSRLFLFSCNKIKALIDFPAILAVTRFISYCVDHFPERYMVLVHFENVTDLMWIIVTVWHFSPDSHLLLFGCNKIIIIKPSFVLGVQTSSNPFPRPFSSVFCLNNTCHGWVFILAVCGFSPHHSFDVTFFTLGSRLFFSF
jgi:hypothetical protein